MKNKRFKSIRKNAEELVTLFLIITFGTFLSLTVDSGYTPVDVQPDDITIPARMDIHPELRPYVLDYVKTLSNAGIRIPYGKDLMIVDLSYTMPSNVLGIAMGMEIDNVVVVMINAREWGGLSFNQRVLLMYHELSHDIFNLYHGDTPVMDTPLPYLVTNDQLSLAIKDLINHLKSKQ